MANVHKSVVFAAHAVIVLGIAYTVARATWFFVSGPAPTPASAVQPRLEERASPVSGGGEPPRIEQLSAQHLFGRPAQERPTGLEATEALRETRLSLELVGVFVADDATSSSALIARKGKPAENYAIGDRLPGNARLTSVYRDRVVITRGESQELIVFDRSEGLIAASGNPPAQPRAAEAVDSPPSLPAQSEPRPARREAALAGETSTSVEALLQNPERSQEDVRQVLEELGVVADDGVPGYTLGAVAERPELSQAGLRRGDRILSVNGRSVAGAESEWRAEGLEMDALLALGSASLEVQRGQRRFFVTVAFD